MTNYFDPIIGLVTKNDNHTENGSLFFAEYLVLKDILNLGFTELDIEFYKNKMFHAYAEKGLYLRSEYHKTRTVSQDEMSGFMVAGSIMQTFHSKDIWQYLEDHAGNYPATGVNKFYNPGSYYSWAVLANSKISCIFAPFYLVNLLISSNKPKQDTSSKLIYLTELWTMKKSSLYSLVLFKYFVWRMKKMYGDKWIKVIYDIYFSMEDKDHPLRDLSERISNGDTIKNL